MTTGIRSLSLPSLLNKYNHEALMEDKKANIIAISSAICCVILIITARLTLNLSKPFFLITGAGIAVIIAVFIWVAIRWRYNRRRKVLETQLVTEGRELRIEYSFLRKVAGVPTKFRPKELEEATDNFGTLLGQGASACVFKGVLSDGTSVAVKRIEGEEHGEKQFKSEVAAIASVQHVNLVRLIGYCFSAGGPRFLVYDFIPNGSLDSWIFQRSSSRRRPGGCLSWDLRYKVAVDVARALSYLHHDCRSRILHLDMKPENILLDESFRAVVGDFGLSRLMGKDESRVVTTIRGTKGYLAPEWLLHDGISEKCDVYSYGMVLLEMIGGRRNVCLIENGSDRSKNKWQYFPKIVNKKVREGNVMEVVDPRLMIEGGIDEREVKKLVYVALWCIQERTNLRPSMKRVVEMLDGRVAIDEPPDTQMVVVDVLAIDEDEEEIDGRVGQNRNAEVRVVQLGDSDNPATSNCSYVISVLSGR